MKWFSFNNLTHISIEVFEILDHLYVEFITLLTVDIDWERQSLTTSYNFHVMCQLSRREDIIIDLASFVKNERSNHVLVFVFLFLFYSSEDNISDLLHRKTEVHMMFLESHRAFRFFKSDAHDIDDQEDFHHLHDSLMFDARFVRRSSSCFISQICFVHINIRVHSSRSLSSTILLINVLSRNVSCDLQKVKKILF
jgi:hypothetical protein